MPVTAVRRPTTHAPRVASRVPAVAPKAQAPAKAVAVAYEHSHRNWWTFWKKTTVREEATVRQVTKMADTAENRKLAMAKAAKDGAQTVIADLGDEIAILSGGTLATRGASAIAALGVASGMNLSIDGKPAAIFHTDTGLAEVDASEVVVAVLDTGVDIHHPALAGRVLPGYNAIDGSDDVADSQGHGTHVAGIIAADGDGPMKGVARNAKILPVKVLGSTNDPNGTIAKGIRYAVDQGAQVINMSFFIRQSEKNYDAVMEALDYAHAKGVVLVKSAGNTGKEGLTDPANHPHVIAVGALKVNTKKQSADRASFSSYGDRLDVAAPGDKVLSLKPGGGYVSMSGTSMAAPHVVGLVALLRAQHPDWTPDQVRAHLTGAVDDLGDAGKDKYYGHGAVNAFKALFGA